MSEGVCSKCGEETIVKKILGAGILCEGCFKKDIADSKRLAQETFDA